MGANADRVGQDAVGGRVAVRHLSRPSEHAARTTARAPTGAAAGFAHHDLVAFLDGTDTPNIKTDRRIKLQCVSSSSGFRRTKHYADFHTNLVDKDD